MAANINTQQPGLFQEAGTLQPHYPASSGDAQQHPGQKNSPLLIVVLCLLIPAITVYGMATMNELRVLAMVLALIGAGVIIARPFWGLIFFVGLLYVRPEESIEALQGMRLTLITSMVTLVALTFQKLLNREKTVKSPLTGMMACFGVAVVMSTMSIGNTSEAIQDIIRLVILIFLVMNLVCTPERYRGFTTAVLVFTGYVAAYSIKLFLSGDALVYMTGEEAGLVRSQATGIFNDPNDLAATIVPGLALALMRVKTSGNIFGRVFYSLFCVLLVYAIFLTDSRGGMLALLTVTSGFCIIFSKRKLLAVAMAVIIGLAFLTFGPARMTTFDSDEDSANSRFWFWANGIEHLKAYPVLGVGYKQFPDINAGMTAHNSFVLCFTETGFVGYFFWMGCIYYCYKKRLIEGLPASEEADKDPPREPGVLSLAQKELSGARLALAGFLMAAFWISRTYIPVFYVLLSLPVAQQIAFSGSPDGFKVSRPVRDWVRIAIISFLSIVFIHLYAEANR